MLSLNDSVETGGADTSGRFYVYSNGTESDSDVMLGFLDSDEQAYRTFGWDEGNGRFDVSAAMRLAGLIQTDMSISAGQYIWGDSLLSSQYITHDYNGSGSEAIAYFSGATSAGSSNTALSLKACRTDGTVGNTSANIGLNFWGPNGATGSSVEMMRLTTTVVSIPTVLDTPDVEAATLSARDGTTALTLTDSTGVVAFSATPTGTDLDFSGTLYADKLSADTLANEAGTGQPDLPYGATIKINWDAGNLIAIDLTNDSGTPNSSDNFLYVDTGNYWRGDGLMRAGASIGAPKAEVNEVWDAASNAKALSIGSTGKVTAEAQLTVIGPFVTPDKAELTLSANTSGAITVTGAYHTVDTFEDGVTGDLETINGGVDGSRIVLQAEHADRTVVLKDGTGNIQGPGDISLTGAYDTVELIYSGALSKWCVISASTNG
jgi:hypothetical protein